jgi:hypothetical protein
MIATSKNQNTDTKMCWIATLSSKSNTHTDLWLNLGLHGDRLVSNIVSNGTDHHQSVTEHLTLYHHPSIFHLTTINITKIISYRYSPINDSNKDLLNIYNYPLVNVHKGDLTAHTDNFYNFNKFSTQGSYFKETATVGFICNLFNRIPPASHIRFLAFQHLLNTTKNNTTEKVFLMECTYIHTHIHLHNESLVIKVTSHLSFMHIMGIKNWHKAIITQFQYPTFKIKWNPLYHFGNGIHTHTYIHTYLAYVLYYVFKNFTHNMHLLVTDTHKHCFLTSRRHKSLTTVKYI